MEKLVLCIVVIEVSANIEVMLERLTFKPNRNSPSKQCPICRKDIPLRETTNDKEKKWKYRNRKHKMNCKAET